jgi:hypothetical protein
LWGGKVLLLKYHRDESFLCRHQMVPPPFLSVLYVKQRAEESNLFSSDEKYDSGEQKHGNFFFVKKIRHLNFLFLFCSIFYMHCHTNTTEFIPLPFRYAHTRIYSTQTIVHFMICFLFYYTHESVCKFINGL